jgi:TolB-like protein
VLIVGVVLWLPRSTRAPRAAPTVTRSLMVLPLTGDAEQIGRRISVQVESLLNGVPGVRVTPGRTLPRRPHTLSDLRNIGTLVNVGTVLYGDVTASGRTMRVTLRLGELPDDTALWAGDFTRDTSLADALAREIADSVARTLHRAAGLIELAIADTSRQFRSAGDRAELSRRLEREGKVEEALREARRAHELHPLDRDIHVNLIQMLRRAGRDAEATRDSALLERMTRYLGGQIVRGGRR